MTAEQAANLGYSIIKASPFEAGLVKDGKGVRTWWLKDFGGKLPPLDHWLVQEAIQIHEDLINGRWPQ